MTIRERVRCCRTIEKLENDKGFCSRAEVMNKSLFQGRPVGQFEKALSDKCVHNSEEQEKGGVSNYVSD